MELLYAIRGFSITSKLLKQYKKATRYVERASEKNINYPTTYVRVVVIKQSIIVKLIYEKQNRSAQRKGYYFQWHAYTVLLSLHNPCTFTLCHWSTKGRSGKMVTPFS